MSRLRLYPGAIIEDDLDGTDIQRVLSVSPTYKEFIFDDMPTLVTGDRFQLESTITLVDGIIQDYLGFIVDLEKADTVFFEQDTGGVTKFELVGDKFKARLKGQSEVQGYIDLPSGRSTIGVLLSVTDRLTVHILHDGMVYEYVGGTGTTSAATDLILKAGRWERIDSDKSMNDAVSEFRELIKGTSLSGTNVASASLFLAYKVYVLSDDGQINDEQKTADFLDLGLTSGKMYAGFAGMKTTVNGRTLIDKLHDLSGNKNTVSFTGNDRPEFFGNSICVEKESTNLHSQGNTMSNWNINSGTVELNADIAPNGLMEAVKITSTGATRWGSSGIALEVGKTYTFSFYVKNIDFDGFRSRVFCSGSEISLDKTYTGEVLTGEWVRVSHTFEVPANTTVVVTRTISQEDNNGKQALFWGAQLEEGSYPTNYIPTTGATVTRAAPSPVIPDVLKTTGSSMGVVNAIRGNLAPLLWGTQGTTHRFLQRSGEQFRYKAFNNGEQPLFTFFPWALHAREKFAYMCTNNTTQARFFIFHEGNIYKSTIYNSGSTALSTNDVVLGDGANLNRHESLYFENTIWNDPRVLVNATDDEIKAIFEQLTFGTSIQTTAEQMTIV